MQDDSRDCVELNTTNPEDLSHQTRDINQNGKQNEHKGTHKDNNSTQNGGKQPNGNGINQLNTELGIAKTKKSPEPLQAFTSLRTSNPTSNGIANSSLPEANEEDNTISCVRNCFQSSRTNHDCSGAEPEIIEVPERQSARIRRSAASGAFRCYKAVRLGFLQCLEDTPFVVPGLVLIILFCVTIIVVIAATGRVSQRVKPWI